MSNDGGEGARLRLADVAGSDQAGPAAGHQGRTGPPLEAEAETPGSPGAADRDAPGPASGSEPDGGPAAAVRRRRFAELLGEFRRSAVLVPLGEDAGDEGRGGFLTADFNGIRFILAFSDEHALARYAVARGEPAREWAYQSVLGAKLLDVAVPAAGVPCGVALDCADGENGMVFPPVRGIVPDAAAVDVGEDGEDSGGGA
ncbi:hypothetical protein [Streptomyces fuscigenes]|uniref:hypothetical protein n=1 Tax=Streptomyces fuscigenes TaxID=1528880 RepID=UPI001F467B81|nr:hypothetical protein [Streptomyces fuscigenes]MCF3960435.1 hypothetical protein [Streptomyces fuscigenes]